jgi:hypothetical protein
MFLAPALAQLRVHVFSPCTDNKENIAAVRLASPIPQAVLYGACRYIGGWPEQADWLPAGQPSVLDVTCELPRTHNNHYLNLPCWDTQGL